MSILFFLFAGAMFAGLEELVENWRDRPRRPQIRRARRYRFN